ncbi:DUF4180 domain-containing protein [Spirosoma sp. HMF3257]|uniref:DUF4180 domain-containing protein n=1 Tax=Spirosoma telluris TaxID=2183553 RepID=A0A327P0L6_9BACT|nr:DUF4180 domain-containing protein [Spirosoma telluris]RAI78718.1 DUF4180 domain-containing protein [Spirosoma telluris]
MEIKIHQLNDLQIAGVISPDMVIKTTDDGLSLLADLYYQGFDSIIIHQKNITPDFFDLKTGIAGEILQKFSNFHVKLAIVGDFTNYSSKSLNDFIDESNKVGQINFVDSVDEALERLGR